jgi:hypothetical protein
LFSAGDAAAIGSPGLRAVSSLELGRRPVAPGPRPARLASFRANDSLKARLPLFPVAIALRAQTSDKNACRRVRLI